MMTRSVSSFRNRAGVTARAAHLAAEVPASGDPATGSALMPRPVRPDTASFSSIRPAPRPHRFKAGAKSFITAVISALVKDGFAGIGAHTGEVYGEMREGRTAEDLISFMEALAKQYPDQKVHIVWDNLNIHHDSPIGISR